MRCARYPHTHKPTNTHSQLTNHSPFIFLQMIFSVEKKRNAVAKAIIHLKTKIKKKEKNYLYEHIAMGKIVKKIARNNEKKNRTIRTKKKRV